MSSKVNVRDILVGHLRTLKDARTGKLSFADIFSFFVIPLIFSFAFIFFGKELGKDVASLLVNFGAIFTALLLSVLVLAYDQSNKLKDKPEDTPYKKLKLDLLKELYFNICYSIIASIILVALCLTYTILLNAESKIPIPFIESFFLLNYGLYLFTPLIVFTTFNLVLTILMVVKRLHSLLTHGH